MGLILLIYCDLLLLNTEEREVEGEYSRCDRGQSLEEIHREALAVTTNAGNLRRSFVVLNGAPGFYYRTRSPGNSAFARSLLSIIHSLVVVVIL